MARTNYPTSDFSPKHSSNMKKTSLLFLLALVFLSSLQAQKNAAPETKTARDARMAWWRNATFGLFIHWGAYAVPAGVYKGKVTKEIGEWIMQTEHIPTSEYEQYVRDFNPTKFDAKAWVKTAKDAGIKYIVITSKHHDGFCLWDSKVTNYDIMEASPFKRDILRELTDACTAAGIRMCFYHSIMDWHQPDAESKAEYAHQNTPNPDWSRYRETYLKPQLVELVKNYDPGVIWFDGEWIPEWTEPQGKDLYQFLRTMKPDLIVNNRVGKGRKGMSGMNAYEDAAGDFGTPEQEIIEGTSDYDWESCMTMNDTWGFKQNDTNWKSSATLVHNLIDIAAKGGNYLLNVGPTADGLIPQASVERLADMGKWLKINGEAIYATHSLKQYKEGNDLKFTTSADGKHGYAIVLKNEKEVKISNLKPRKGSVIKMLGVAKALKYRTQTDGSLVVTMPQKLPCDHAWVLKMVM